MRSVLERVRSLVQAHDIAPRVAQLCAAHEHEAALLAAHQAAEARVGVWDRLMFFRKSPDQHEAAAQRAAYDEAVEAREAALQAWREAMAEPAIYVPVEILFAIESATEEVLSDPDVGRVREVGAPIADVLRETASRVKALWLPEVDFTRVARRFVIGDERGRSASETRPALREHDELGCAPVDEDDVAIYIAHALNEDERFEAVMQAHARELSEDQRALARLEEVRSEISTVDLLSPFDSYTQKMAKLLADELEAEEKETREVFHLMKSHVARAFCAHPLCWLFVSLLGAAWALRTARGRKVRVIDASGELTEARSGGARAVILMCLVEVRAAAEAAFPGVPALIWPRGEVSGAAPRAASPYRARQAAEEAPADDAELFEALEQRGLRKPLLDAAVASGIHGLLVFEREREELYEDHVGWMSRHAEQALHLVDRVAYRHHGALALAATLAHASHLAPTIHTPTGRRSTCPAVNKDETLEALSEVASVLRRFFHVRGERDRWMKDAAERIYLAEGPIHAPEVRQITSYAEVITLLSAHLRTTEFLWLHRTVAELTDERVALEQEVGEASNSISFWDKVDVLSDSHAETRRKVARAKLRGVERKLAERTPELDALFDAARDLYPPLRIAEGVSRVRERVEAIHTTASKSTKPNTYVDDNGMQRQGHAETYLTCRIDGVEEAVEELGHLRRLIVDLLGPLPTRSDALEAWIRREL